ncbi:MAG: CDP-alcohol phosphatidyltransferase family protein [Nitrososphaerota archaeon]
MSRNRRRREFEKRLMRRLSGGLVRLFVEKGVSPLHLTYSAFALSLFASALYAFSGTYLYLTVLAAVALLASAFLDALDGEVARLSSRVTRLGAFLDSMLDKIAEASVCLGIAFSGLVEGYVVLLFCASSLLVGYARARAEGVGVDLAGVGIAERAERIIILSTASLIAPLHPQVLAAALYLGSILSLITVALRVFRVAAALRGEGGQVHKA